MWDCMYSANEMLPHLPKPSFEIELMNLETGHLNEMAPFMETVQQPTVVVHAMNSDVPEVMVV